MSSRAWPEELITLGPERIDALALLAQRDAVPMRAIVDDSPAWSPDGRWIAFHRRLPSSYGPPGLYLISRHGGEPRFLLPGGLFFPREVSFSPDGQRLVCNAGNQLAFVDLRTGAVSRPFFTDNGATHPDWSPNGRDVVYFRIFLKRFPPEPVDSAGLHIFDVETETDRLLWSGFGSLPAGPSRWIRNGAALAILHGVHGDWHLSVGTVDGRELHDVMSVPFPKVLWNLQRLIPSRPRGGPLATESVVLLVLGQQIEKTLQVTMDPIGVSERSQLGLWDALSPTGQEVVVVAANPTDSLGVLYVKESDSSPRARMRPLTRYDPP